MRRSGLDEGDRALVQAVFDSQVNWFPSSFCHDLWGASSAFLGLDIEFGGVVDPADEGHPAGAPSGWYDFASLLLEEQNDDGSWPSARPNHSDGGDIVADAASAPVRLELRRPRSGQSRAG